MKKTLFVALFSIIPLLADPNLKQLEIKFDFIDEAYVTKHGDEFVHEVQCSGGNVLLFETKHSKRGGLKQLHVKHKDESMIQSDERTAVVFETLTTRSERVIIFKFKYAFSLEEKKVRGLKQLAVEMPGAIKGQSYSEDVSLSGGNVANFRLKY